MVNDFPPPGMDDARLPSISPKRRAPKTIEPIISKHIKYTLSMVKDDEVSYASTIMQAFDESESLLWQQEIYRIKFVANLETDVQEVYPVSMVLNPSGNSVIIENERGAQFEIQLQSQQVSQINQGLSYSPSLNSN